MPKHKHDFVNQFDDGLIAFGISRESDEQSLIAYLQKFTDDDLLKLLVKRLSDEEITGLVDTVIGTLKQHLSKQEYHDHFLKEAH